MTPLRIILLSLLAIWLVLGLAMLVPEDRSVRGVRHAEHSAIIQGGDGLARHGPLLWYGLAFAFFQLSVIVGLLSLGLRSQSRSPCVIPMLTGFLLLLIVFAAIFVTYRTFMTESRIVLLGPFPVPTTFMVFGIWAASFYFVFLYVMNFQQLVFSPEDADKFQRLLDDRREMQEGGE